VRRRIALATSSMLILGAIAAAVVSAQQPLQTIQITVGARSVSVEGAENLQAGPARVEFRLTGRGEVEGYLTALRSGRTVADLREALPRANRGPAPVKRIVTFEASGAPPRGGVYATTIDLRPGATYVAANISDNIRNTRLASFTVGTVQGTGVRPTPRATVGLYDYAFGMPDALPRRGTVRFEHRGRRLHIAIAFPVRTGANRAAAVQALIRNQQRRFTRLVNVRGAREVLGTVSGGTINDVEVNFPRRGDWLFACFIEDGERGNPSHSTLGMVKAFRVR